MRLIYELDPKTTALLLIDVQMEYVDPRRPLSIRDVGAIIRRIASAVSAARAAGAYVVHLKHESEFVVLSDGRFRLTEHFQWDSRVGGGTNIFEEIQA